MLITIRALPDAYEFVHVYPNPAKNLINLAYQAQTTGTVYFVLSDELGQTVLTEKLSEAQNFAQYQIGNLSNGLYYWKLKDSSRIIKADKIVIMK